jgi:DNA-binding transcriptional regulator GbsR (MarR family)
LLFFSACPLSLDEIADQIEISKASASTGARQLVHWGAIRQVWVPGDRRDFFQLAADPATLLMEMYREFLQPRLGIAADRLRELNETLQEDLAGGALSQQEFDVCRERLDRLSQLQSKLQSASPLIQGIL